MFYSQMYSWNGFLPQKFCSVTFYFLIECWLSWYVFGWVCARFTFDDFVKLIWFKWIWNEVAWKVSIKCKLMLFSLIFQIPNLNACKFCFSSNHHAWPNLIQIKSSQTSWNIISCSGMGFGLEIAKPNKLLSYLWPICQTKQTITPDLLVKPNKLLLYLWFTCQTKQTITLFVATYIEVCW